MCKSPLKGFQIGFTENHKPKYMITSYHVDHVEKVKGIWRKEYDSFISSMATEYVKDYTEIPCGHCIQCYLENSKTWADRCMMEFSDYEPCECWFLTLTYDNEHIPKVEMDSDIPFEEPLPFIPTLVLDDLQRFWKRLRQEICRNYEEKSRLRYFACGEYGENTFRPHYHAIVFGLPYVDLQSWAKSKTGNPLFRSIMLEKIWGNGIVSLSPISWNTCAYTARYVLKKADKSFDQKLYERCDIIPEFRVMSRRPGIGRSYYELNKEKIYKYDEIILSTSDGGKIVKPPRYFDQLFEAEDPVAYEEIKERRKENAEAIKMLKLSHTDLEYWDMLQAEAITLNGRLKALRRDKI